MHKCLKEAEKILNEYLDTIAKDTSKKFYETRIMKFFNEHMSLQEKPLKAISFYDIDSFIKELKVSNSERLNYYYACKGFFSYTYYNEITVDVMKGVDKPIVQINKATYMDNKDILKFIEFTMDSSQPLIERLLIGFFIYTGLSRQYIAKLTHHQINIDSPQYMLHFDTGKDGEVYVPLKQELIQLINELKQSQKEVVKRYERVFKNYGENYISTKIAELSKRIVGKKYKPTDFSSTFIRNAILAGNDIYTIRNIVLESIGTIEKHFPEQYDVLETQKKLLESLYKV